jgi:hypothetical protein
MYRPIDCPDLSRKRDDAIEMQKRDPAWEFKACRW